MANCKYCDAEFAPRKRYGYDGRSDQKFCSRSCYTDYRRNVIGNKRITIQCDKCGKEIRRWPSQIGKSNYCSKSCANSANHPSNNPGRTYTPPVEKQCENCGEPFKVFPYRAETARFCSRDCAYEYRTTTTPKPRDNGLRQLPNECMICGFDTVVHVHHIIPKREGGTDKIENLIVLCPNHHAMADRKLISRSKLIKINRAAIAPLSETQPQSHQPTDT